jgi:phosphoserine aminotransferase
MARTAKVRKDLHGSDLHTGLINVSMYHRKTPIKRVFQSVGRGLQEMAVPHKYRVVFLRMRVGDTSGDSFSFHADVVL